MKNGIKLVGYTFKVINYVKIPPLLSYFSEQALPLAGVLSGNLNICLTLLNHRFFISAVKGVCCDLQYISSFLFYPFDLIFSNSL